MPSKRSGARTSRSTGPTFPRDWHEFLSLLISHRVKFVIVGGHAVSVHARPRMTEDLDVFVEASEPNATRLREVLSEFGFGAAAPDVRLLAEPDRVFMLGVKPFRIDILTRISGVTFAQAWRTRVTVATSAGRLPFLGKALLVTNKTASNRPKDLADLAALDAATAPRRTR